MGFQGSSARFKMHRYIRLNGWLNGKKIQLQSRRPRFDLWVGKIPWRREWLPTSVFLPGEFHGHRSLVGYSPWDHERVRHDLGIEQSTYTYQCPPTHRHIPLSGKIRTLFGFEIVTAEVYEIFSLEVSWRRIWACLFCNSLGRAGGGCWWEIRWPLKDSRLCGTIAAWSPE